MRLATGRWEYPAGADWWQEALRQSGFHHVRLETLPHEGGIASAEAPPGFAGVIRLTQVHGSASSAAVPGTLPSEASLRSASGSCSR